MEWNPPVQGGKQRALSRWFGPQFSFPKPGATLSYKTQLFWHGLEATILSCPISFSSSRCLPRDELPAVMGLRAQARHRRNGLGIRRRSLARLHAEKVPPQGRRPDDPCEDARPSPDPGGDLRLGDQALLLRHQTRHG